MSGTNLCLLTSGQNFLGTDCSFRTDANAGRFTDGGSANGHTAGPWVGLFLTSQQQINVFSGFG